MNDEIKFKFVVGWYDGPLDGICEFNEKEYWFNIEKLIGNQTIYGIYKLSKKEIEYENFQYKRLKEHQKIFPQYNENHFFWIYSSRIKEKEKILSKKNFIGYFDDMEMKLRQTKVRDYFVEGECPNYFGAEEYHKCHGKKFINWRKDAIAINPDYSKQKIEGWALLCEEYSEKEWNLISHCPFCGKELPKSPV